MTNGWRPKRFWSETCVVPCAGGFGLQLDGRDVKTPAKAPLVVPSRALALEIAAEWQAQKDDVRPETMPATRMANSAIDKVAPMVQAVVDEIAGYGGSDLLCYRADEPAELAARQALGWDAPLAWARGALGVDLVVTAGVMAVEQSAESQARLRALVAGRNAFELAALHDLTAISGSLILALAVTHGHMSGQEAFDLSRIDEAWQSEKWGADSQAAEAEAAHRAGLLIAERFYHLCGEHTDKNAS